LANEGFKPREKTGTTDKHMKTRLTAEKERLYIEKARRHREKFEYNKAIKCYKKIQKQAGGKQALNIVLEIGRMHLYRKDYENEKYILKDNREKLKIKVITGRKNHTFIMIKFHSGFIYF